MQTKDLSAGPPHRSARGTRRKDVSLAERAQLGAGLGLFVGLFAMYGLDAAYAGTPGDGPFVLFLALIFAGTAAGGGLAGALLGPAQQLLGSTQRAASVGAGLMAVTTAGALAATWPFTEFTAGGVAAYFGVSAVAGAMFGMLARDAIHYAPAGEATVPKLRTPPLWVLLLVELGWMMDALPTPRSRRREQLRRAPVPDAWRRIVHSNVPLFSRLRREDQAALLGHVNVFLAETQFEGCGGLQVTDEIRVTVAAQACLLLLHTPSRRFPTLRTVLVYPGSFVAPSRTRTGGIHSETEEVLLGESWRRGEVVLSWRSVAGGAANPDDGENVVLHEFAHQLDQVDGEADGIPEMRSFGAYRAWAEVLAHRFAAFQRATERGERGTMDPYGATNRAEFFAVATETFFEKPLQMRRKEPELYDQLRAYYGLDPAGAAEREPA